MLQFYICRKNSKFPKKLVLNFSNKNLELLFISKMENLRNIKKLLTKHRKLVYIVMIPLLASILPLVANNKVFFFK